MGVLMQAFHWDCPRQDRCEYAWWNHVREQTADLARTGFTALWLPPVHKAANIGGPSMGYDPYDYYDLGEYEQKGAAKTWFGSKHELLDLIAEAHAQRLTVIADIVINHNSGADATEVNPITGQSRWTRFEPASGLFPRTWECFHPNMYESWDEGTFGEMPDLSHRNPYVFGEILKLARWLVETIGFDGFRYDFVKGYGASTVAAIQEYRYMRAGQLVRPYGVAEFWGEAQAIQAWADLSNLSNANPVDAFDFPLREALKRLCDAPDFKLHDLVNADTLLRRQTQTTVTFVENHDLRDPGRPIVDDKLLAYSYICTHEGYPCVFWKDYYNDGLALDGTANGIAALVAAHEKYAGGATQTLWLEDHVYIMQRTGYGDTPGLIYVLNTGRDAPARPWVTTAWPSSTFTPVAWWGATDRTRPDTQTTGPDGRAQFSAAPRGYAVFAPAAAP